MAKKTGQTKWKTMKVETSEFFKYIIMGYYLPVFIMLIGSIYFMNKPKIETKHDDIEKWVITSVTDTSYYSMQDGQYVRYYRVTAYNLENSKNCVKFWDKIKPTYSQNDTIKLFSKK